MVGNRLHIHLEVGSRTASKSLGHLGMEVCLHAGRRALVIFSIVLGLSAALDLDLQGLTYRATERSLEISPPDAS